MKIVRLLVCLVAVTGAGCGDTSDNGTLTGPGALNRLTISRPLPLTNRGQTVQLTATAQFGTTLKTVTSETQWTSLDPAIATVSPGGLVTAAGLGQTTISGTYQSLTETTPVAVLFAARSLRVAGNVALGAVGDTSQLTATATLLDGQTADVTNVASWVTMTIPSAIRVSGGLVTADALGWGQVNVTYGTELAATPVTVTPPGTYTIRGFVKLPGHAGVPDFRVVDTQSGRTTTTSVVGPYAPGWYTLGGLAGSTRIAFDKPGFEPADLVVTGPAVNGGGEIKVQQIYRIAAGETVDTRIAPHDVEYAVGSERCVNCRLIRVGNPTGGTLHLTLSCDVRSAALTLWVNGRRFAANPGEVLNAEIPVTAGEVVLLAGVGTGDLGYVRMSLATSLTASAAR